MLADPYALLQWIVFIVSIVYVYRCAPGPGPRRGATRSARGTPRPADILHARPGAAADLLEAAAGAHSSVAWAVSIERMLDEGWFGPVVSSPVRSRLGDVALVAHADVSFDDPSDTGPYPLVCRHGSLTSAEVYVPLLAAFR